MPDATRVGGAAVTVDGAPLPAALYDDLIDVRVEQSVRLPDRFTLRFRDPEFELLDAGRFAVGNSIDLGLSDGTTDAVVTRSEVTSLGVDQGTGGRHELVVSGLSRAHRLARGPKVRTFLKVTDAEVVRTIASEHGLRAQCDATTVNHPYLLQAQTDFAFLTERAMASGFSWWVSDRTLFFKSEVSSGSGPKLVFGDNLMRFRLRCSSTEASSQVVVRSWDPDTQRAIVGMSKTLAATDPGVELASAAPIAANQMKKAAAFSSGVVRTTGRVGVADNQEADLLARSLGHQSTSEQVTAKGEVVGNPLLKAGTEVEISGVGKQLSGTYVLTSVEHVVGTSRGYVTRFNCAGRRPGGLVDLLGPGVSEPWATTGLVVAIVTNIKDPEKLGRVKVKYPTLSDKDESWWARVAAVGAGPAHGLQSGFAVGDEVLVGFEHGDLRRPIVVGGLWSVKKRPPQGTYVDDSGKVVSQAWHSHAGHVVELHDSQTPAQSYFSVTLKDKKTKLVLREDGVTIETPNPITITSQQTISMKATGDVTIEGANVNINAKAKVNVEGAQVLAKGKATIQLEGAQASLKGTGMVSVEGGALAQVKGAILKLN